MRVDIISPEKKLFSGEAVAVQLPGSEGLFQVLDNHAPIISTLTAGIVVLEIAEKNSLSEEWRVNLEGNHLSIEIKGGVVEVKNNTLSLLAD
ncbi:MAG: hypothetical protein JJU02_07725 [Cryomorphaceae bacterium]|nr:hypothetical protein [Cryomorphaceae bacterium]